MLAEQSVEYWVKINVHFILNNSRYMYAIKTELHLKDVCSFFSGMNGQLYPDSLVAGALAMALCRILGIFQQSYNIVLSIILITVNAITHVHCTC